MPRPKQAGSIASEDALARRVERLRLERGWTYEALSGHMRAAGRPIDPSALYRIEKGSPRRRITVDELVGFSVVFDLNPDDLLLPPELVDQRRAQELVDRLLKLDGQFASLVADMFDAECELTEIALADDELRHFVEGHQEARTPEFPLISLDADKAVRGLYAAVRNAAVATVHNKRNRKK